MSMSYYYPSRELFPSSGNFSEHRGPVAGIYHYGPYNVGGRFLRKPKRAAQACHSCRKKRKRCDEKLPCGGCQEDGNWCDYNPESVDRSSQSFQRAFTQVNVSTHQINELSERLGQVTARLDLVEKRQNEAKQQARRVAPSTTDNEAERDPYSATQHLIKRWPTVYDVLLRAQIWVDAAYVYKAEWIGTTVTCRRAMLSPRTNPYRPISSLGKRKLDFLNDEGYCSFSATSGPDEITRQDRAKSLLRSYVENIHILHPIVDLVQLEFLFDGIPSRTSSRRSSIDTDDEADLTTISNKRRKLHRASFSQLETDVRVDADDSVRHALLYIILAIGEVCECKKSTKHAVQPIDSNDWSHEPPFDPSMPLDVDCPSDALYPMSDDLSAWASQPRTPTPTIPVFDQEQMFSRPVSMSGSEHLRPPGLRYFERAARIMGLHLDGNELMHAQVALLSAIYKGQVGRVRESMNWICIASRMIQNLLHSRGILSSAEGPLARLGSPSEKSSEPKDPKHNFIILAAWTCIQLESDVLAELPYPPSGILAYENKLPWPTLIPGVEAYSRILPKAWRNGDISIADAVLTYYTQHLSLRASLNNIQPWLFGNPCLSLSCDEVQTLLIQQQDALDLWRENLPSPLKWQDEDAPSNDMLDARLRARYWSALFLANRPFLDYFLNLKPNLEDEYDVSYSAVDAQGRQRSSTDIHIFEAIRNSWTEPQLWEATTRCLQAACQSTRVFDGIPHELILTNFHGTAHAKFNNLLVLAAAYFGSSLRATVVRLGFEGLIKRTIEFFERSSWMPRSCEMDCSMLKKLLRVVLES